MSGVPAAAKLAGSVDSVILALGTDLTWAREGHDADPVDGLRLPQGQLALLKAVVERATTPIIVVLLTATPLDISILLTDPRIGAIVHVGQPSVAIRGVGDVLYGVTPPAGRLVQTIYPAEYSTQISIFDFNMRPGRSEWPAPGCVESAPRCPNGTNPGRTYRFYTKRPVLPFGYGLSYTTFRYQVKQELGLGSGAGGVGAADSDAEPVVSLDRLRSELFQAAAASRSFVPAAATLGHQNAPIKYQVRVSNTGAVDSDDVVLGFLAPPGAGKDGVPLKQLFGFERVHVRAGESVTTWLYPSLTDLSFVDIGGGVRRPLPGRWSASFGVRETVAHGMGFAEHSFLAV